MMCYELNQAYVTQDDNLIGTLTVRETISYSARLRLPDNMPWEDKRALVESTIVAMGLQDCADTVIGNWHLRGISGGEKRRVSIALEILMRPRLLFLDEPTSGLDRLLHITLCEFNFLVLSGLHGHMKLSHVYSHLINCYQICTVYVTLSYSFAFQVIDIYVQEKLGIVSLFLISPP